MPRFSVRHGHIDARTFIQRENLDAETRMAVWNVLAVFPQIFNNIWDDQVESKVLESMWIEHFQRARDERPYNSEIWAALKKEILESEWTRVFDLLELFVENLDHYKSPATESFATQVAEALNGRFEIYLVGYRFIGQEITPIDSAIEVEAVQTGIDDAKPLQAAHHHLGKALEHLSDRQNPDYLNSIKESISAVEAVAVKITGKQTLGEALRALPNEGVDVHSALLKAWGAMYGFTSDAGGVRHGGQAVANVDQTLAKYILVTSSAFVSYLIESGRKAGALEN